MKSIIEEASSIIKAIENAWVRAGQPAAFQVKVYEEPKRNFFGLTVRSAKIGLFFAEEMEKVPKPAKQVVRKERCYPATVEHRESPTKRIRDGEAIIRSERRPKGCWSHDMIKFSREWLDQTLSIMGFADIVYSIEPRDYYLHVLFETPIFADRVKEQQLFKSFAHLIMQMLRTKFKKGFAGFKVVLNVA